MVRRKNNKENSKKPSGNDCNPEILSTSARKKNKIEGEKVLEFSQRSTDEIQIASTSKQIATEDKCDKERRNGTCKNGMSQEQNSNNEELKSLDEKATAIVDALKRSIRLEKNVKQVYYKTLMDKESTKMDQDKFKLYLQITRNLNQILKFFHPKQFEFVERLIHKEDEQKLAQESQKYLMTTKEKLTNELKELHAELKFRNFFYEQNKDTVHKFDDEAISVNPNFMTKETKTDTDDPNGSVEEAQKLYCNKEKLKVTQISSVELRHDWKEFSTPLDSKVEKKNFEDRELDLKTITEQWDKFPLGKRSLSLNTEIESCENTLDLTDDATSELDDEPEGIIIDMEKDTIQFQFDIDGNKHILAGDQEFYYAFGEKQAMVFLFKDVNVQVIFESNKLLVSTQNNELDISIRKSNHVNVTDNDTQTDTPM